jgi:NAD(P)H-nitrite reductase large subunit
MTRRRRKNDREEGRQYLIIGNSAAGIAAAREIRRRDPRGRIMILSDEPTFGYSRVMLPLYIAGKIGKREMVIAPRADYAQLGIKLLRRDPVESIDPKAQRVDTRKGACLPYDCLLITTGASPRRLEIPGKDLPGIHYLRKISDAEEIRKDLYSTPGPVLLIGGGLVSVKTLEALIHKKRKVHMVISSDRILSQMLDQRASNLYLDVFQKKGITVRFHTDVLAFEGKERVKGALLSDGTPIPCSLAIIGKGVKPNVALLEGTGIRLKEGVVVDPHMATNLPSIYAAGDVAETLDLLEKKHQGQAIWPLAVEGGRVAGSNMASSASTLSGGLRMNVVELMEMKAVSAGAQEGQEVLTHLSPGNSLYRKLVFSGGRLTGYLLAGDIRCAGVLTSLVKNGTPVSPSDLEEGLERGFSFSPRLRSLAGQIRSS